MGLLREIDRRGNKVLVVRRTWPDKTRLRRVVKTVRDGRELLSRIEHSILVGEWRELRDALRRGPCGRARALTVADLCDRYMADYVQRSNRRPDFKVTALSPVRRLCGRIEVKSFRRADAHEFAARRGREVATSTVNRSLAVLKHMFAWAVDSGILEKHPMERFKLARETRRSIRIPSPEEVRRLIGAAASMDPGYSAYLTVLAETGLRMREGLRLTWADVDQRNGTLVVRQAKSGRPRVVPLSRAAAEAVASLVRVVGVPEMFVRLDRKPWVCGRDIFVRARRAAGLDWLGIHGLRHYRATRWISGGMDLRTVQELLGHSAIETTMRYAHYLPERAAKLVRMISQDEEEEAGMAANGPTMVRRAV